MRRVHRGRRRGSWGRPGGGASSSAPPASPQAEPPGVMGRLLLVLWALLGSRACAGGAAEPGKGRRGLRGRQGLQAGGGAAPPRRVLPAGKNLSCYQCFKVKSLGSCRPAACASADEVCVSNTVIFVRSESPASAEGASR